ncbi:tetratricopeptide repeat-containing sensor histidine kinase [Spirosoma rhododendri]|uniref:histidine kinase n=1 Tax=Spirosoma rhododendri TaxID=2728024 RepID=A0A7L5DP19_9BACT|nr:tetratricopeptide repeat protein [Spirosoma rhododendri]QJD80234.1 tetratricopeptide repeat protein [Spirosoma rhododendri]
MRNYYGLLMAGLAGLLLSQSVKAQLGNVDSSARYLKTHAPVDTAYVRAMDPVIIDMIYKKSEYARADSMSKQMIDLATRLRDWNGVIRGYRSKTILNLMSANYEQSIANSKKALEIADQHNMPPVIIGGLLSNMAAGYDRMGNAPMVFQTALRAIQLQEKHDFRPRSPVVYRLIGGALVKMGKKEQALPYYQKAGVLFRELGDPRGIAIFENQLGELYNTLNQPQQAMPHLRESLKLAEQLKFDMLQFDVFDGMATSLRLLNKPDEGLEYARRSLAIAEKQQNKLAVCHVYGTIASLYQTQKDYVQAETYLKKAMTLAEDNDYKDDRKKLTQQMADLYGVQNKYQLAYTFQLEKNRQVDSAIAIRTNAELQRMVAQYETEKKEARIKLLQRETQLLQQAKRLDQEEARQVRWQRNAGLIGGLLLLLLGGAVSAWLLNRSKVQRLEESQRLRQRIAHDLHDEVGSTLSSISLLSGHTDKLLSENRPETAQRMVQKIYVDARQILESIDEIIWTINPGNDSLQRIVMRLQEYAQPLMESKQIAFTFSVDPSLEQLPVSMEVRRNLYLIGKEAINNLIKYSEATLATMRFERRGDQFAVLLEDNGRGFDTNQLSSRTGQQSMQQRAIAMGGTLTVQSTPGQGTRLELTAATL